MKSGPIVVEHLFQAPAEQIWTAITDKDEMKKWYFDLPEFLPVTGCEFHFIEEQKIINTPICAK